MSPFRFCLFILLLLNCHCLNSIAHADFDLDFGLNYRFYPQAATAESTIGYGHLLWGSTSEPLYGFTRIAFTAEGITDYFSNTVMFEVFPVSILGARVGNSWSENYKDYSAYNCTDYLCRGRFESQFFEVPFFIEFWSFSLIASWRSEQWQITDHPQLSNQIEFVEPSSGLPLSITGQHEVERKQIAVFYKLDETWRAGVTETQYEGESSGPGYKTTYARLRAVLVQFQVKGVFTSQGNFSVVIGAGEFRSQLALTDPTFFLSLKFSPLSKIGY